MMKRTLGLALAAGILSAGCSVDYSEGDEALGELVQGLSCTDTQVKKYEVEATIAVAMGNELHRWTPKTDLRTDGYAVYLTDAAKQRCNERGYPGCPNTQALMDIQFSGLRDMPADQLRNTLVTHLRRYLSEDQNRKFPVIPDVDLIPNYTTQWSCGTMFWYRAVEGGTVTATTADKLFYQMIAFGGATQWGQTPENPFLNFQSSGSDVGIDPQVSGLSTDTTTTSASLSCYNNTYKYDCTGSWVGTKCCSGGTLQKSSGCMLICK